jgi:hypothetical protein
VFITKPGAKLISFRELCILIYIYICIYIHTRPFVYTEGNRGREAEGDRLGKLERDREGEIEERERERERYVGICRNSTDVAPTQVKEEQQQDDLDMLVRSQDKEEIKTEVKEEDVDRVAPGKFLV